MITMSLYNIVQFLTLPLLATVIGGQLWLSISVIQSAQVQLGRPLPDLGLLWQLVAVHAQ